MKLDDFKPLDDEASAKTFIEECTHFIVFTEEDEDGKLMLYHAIGYKSEPSENDIEHAIKEVKDDPEFGLDDEIDDLNITVISGQDAEELKEYLRSTD